MSNPKEKDEEQPEFLKDFKEFAKSVIHVKLVDSPDDPKPDPSDETDTDEITLHPMTPEEIQKKPSSTN